MNDKGTASRSVELALTRDLGGGVGRSAAPVGEELVKGFCGMICRDIGSVFTVGWSLHQSRYRQARRARSTQPSVPQIHLPSKNGCFTNGRFGISPAGRCSVMSSNSIDGAAIETTFGPATTENVRPLAGDETATRIGAL